MKRSSFRQKTPQQRQEAQAKKRAKLMSKPKEVRTTALKPKKRLKATVGPQKRKKRDKLPSIKTVRNKCDNLLTPIIKEMYPYCLLQGATTCAKVTQVAHHHVHKSKSSRLRYDLENLIPLCGMCHVMLHNDESFWGAKVAQIKGDEWFRYIEKAKQESVKTDVHFYIENFEKLSKMV